MTTLNASEHAIKSVTIYRTAAEVVRPFALDLKVRLRGIIGTFSCLDYALYVVYPT
ncbi:uncharacterized protein B0H18DRAFT_995193 [Fomitopsis serialis]|uniref:uncharacterized protein n=1 Tax=Fomitopsis serialis TaxID=139415 RepID=UPI0020077878|nr:uncharacterized protein B0H18DRAFT_995193 [Neoantrodia serialis]KAH9930093.1 hypothetical protein B0H18DRAFT_995193 [Neoantrodia serialis]